jgi:aspartyl-tRNA(Asn)/glutamyl-tRNA(Gln) amidotransferase subunit A
MSAAPSSPAGASPPAGPTGWTISSIRRALESRQISARELAQEFFAQIERENPRLNAFLVLSPERAFAQAGAIDAKIARRESLPPLAGVPAALKDVLNTRGTETTAGSKILKGYVPPYDATAIERLDRAGAIFLGKTNCDEFAMGSSNENSAFGPVHNPAALDRVPGGSSGGSAAAVAAALAVIALGTDTGGSIRQPGAMCGVPAMMPTYGRVSRYGLIAFASSLDRIGPFARTVEDVARVMEVIAGRDPLDATSAGLPVPPYTAEMDVPVKGLRLGIPAEYFAEGLDPAVHQKVEAGIGKLKELGCIPTPIEMSHMPYAIPTYYLIATAEASSNLARFDGVRYGLRVPGATLGEMYRKTRGAGFGPEVKRRIMLGTYALSAGYYDAFYLKAQKVRTLIKGDFDRAFQQVDLILAPTSPVTAFRLGERTADPLAMYLADIYTVTGSLAGITAISLPCGKVCGTLPVGLQIMGPHFEEGRVLRLARAFEAAGGFDL